MNYIITVSNNTDKYGLKHRVAYSATKESSDDNYIISLDDREVHVYKEDAQLLDPNTEVGSEVLPKDDLNDAERFIYYHGNYQAVSQLLPEEVIQYGLPGVTLSDTKEYAFVAAVNRYGTDIYKLSKQDDTEYIIESSYSIVNEH